MAAQYAKNVDQFDAYFRRADLDGDGQISGAEAVAFFQGSGLLKQILAQVWTYADHKKVGYLGREEFYNALKLVTVAQSKRELTPEIVKAALHGPASAKIPAPQINLAATPFPKVGPGDPASGASAPTAQGMGVRPLPVPTSVGASQQQHLPTQQKGSLYLNPPQVLPRHRDSSMALDLLAGSTSPQISSLPVGTPIQDGFGPSTSNLIPAVQSTPVIQQMTNDPMLPSASLRGDAPSSASGSVPASSASGSVPASSASGSVPASSAMAPLAKPNYMGLATLSQLPVSASTQAHHPPPPPPWPAMTQFDVQKYMKVFMQVDTDGDGKITGEQARNLFLSWRLPREVLKQVWDLADQDNDSMLSAREFCIALYLMERYREGRALPATIPATIVSEEALLATKSQMPASSGSETWGHSSALQQPRVMAMQPTPAITSRPPRPPPMPSAVKPPGPQKPKVPVLEKELMSQLSPDEQDMLNLKLRDATEADKKVGELEKDISESKQKIEFYRAKMQELILYKSRCDNRLNEVTERLSSEKREIEALAKKYEEKYKEVGDVASRLTIEEATFRDIQEKKMEIYRAIVKLEDGGSSSADVLKERVEHIQSSLDDLTNSMNQRCKQYGLRVKPTSLIELPFGWQPGIQGGAADWDDSWDKFEDEGYEFVKELTLDVQNVVAPPKPKSSLAQKDAYSEKAYGTTVSSSSNEETKGITAASSGETESQSCELHQDGPFRDTIAPHSTLNHNSENDKIFDEPEWGRVDPNYDSGSAWGLDSDGGEGIDPFGLVPNPIKVKEGSPILFADSVPTTPSSYMVPGSPLAAFSRFDSFTMPDSGAVQSPRPSLARFDSMRSTHESEQNHGFMSRFDSFKDSNSTSSVFARFDSFKDGAGNGHFDSPAAPSLARFDSIRDSSFHAHGLQFDPFGHGEPPFSASFDKETAVPRSENAGSDLFFH